MQFPYPCVYYKCTLMFKKANPQFLIQLYPEVYLNFNRPHLFPSVMGDLFVILTISKCQRRFTPHLRPKCGISLTRGETDVALHLKPVILIGAQANFHRCYLAPFTTRGSNDND